MKLRYSMGSPFGRKAAMAVHALGLTGSIEMIDHDADKSNEVRQINPLHKIPMLIADDGSPIFDSPVILEYLDEIAGGGKIIPARGLERYKTLSRLALADGITEASILIHYEDRWREPAQKAQPWIEHQLGKIKRAIAEFEKDVPKEFDAAAMGLVCALTFVTREGQWDWRPHAPKLAAWLDDVSKNEPAVAATVKKT